MLEVVELVSSRGSFTTPAVSFSLPEGKCVILKGKNGSGKTTILLAIIGYFPVKSGFVFYRGLDVLSMSLHSRMKIFSILQQIPPSFSYLSAREVVEIGSSEVKNPDEFLEMWKAEKFKNRRFSDLSGGERKLVLLARIWARNTPVIILDEPDAFLDEDNRRMLAENIISSMEKGTSFIITTHDRWLAEKIPHEEVRL